MRARVLVVDDDPALAEMLGIVLRSEGFMPSFVADGERALAAFRDSRPDIVLLDLMLPGMSGIDVARAIRGESGVPIVMLTAKSDTVDVVLGLESGADDYVVKPFKPKELVARMRAAAPGRGRRAGAAYHRPARQPDRHRRAGAHRQPQRRGGEADAAGVRPAGRARPQTASGLHPGGAAGAGLGLPARGGHPAGQRARAATTCQDRADPERPEIILTVRGVGYKAGTG